MHILSNIVLFQIGWFACILGAAYGYPWAGTALALLIIALHLLVSGKPAQEIYLMILVAVIGIAIDASLIAGGWLVFDSGVLLEGFPPHWMVALWLIFATTLNYSLAWLKAHKFLAAALGFIGGPLAYYAGASLGAVTMSIPDSLIAIAIAWAIATPVMLWLAQFLTERICPQSIKRTQYV